MILLPLGDPSSGLSKPSPLNQPAQPSLEPSEAVPAAGSQSQQRGASPSEHSGRDSFLRATSPLPCTVLPGESSPPPGPAYHSPSPPPRSAFWASYLSCNSFPGPELLRLGVQGPDVHFLPQDPSLSAPGLPDCIHGGWGGGATHSGGCGEGRLGGRGLEVR